MLRRVVGTILVSMVLLGCSDKPLTGPNAQDAFVRVRDDAARHMVLGDSILIIIDGRVMAWRDSVARLDPRVIARIELVKGPAAQELYGAAARNGAIRIYTQASPPARPTH